MVDESNKMYIGKREVWYGIASQVDKMNILGWKVKMYLVLMYVPLTLR